jgi:hypothetical protein
MKTTPKLIAIDGMLFTPLRPDLELKDPALFNYFKAGDDGSAADGHVMLLVEHAGGDNDTIKYLNPNEEHLRSALYNAREQGLIDDAPTVILPDGTEFTI